MGLIRCEVVSQGNELNLDSFYVQKMYVSYADFTGFSLHDTTPFKAFVLLGGIAALLLTIAAWVVLYRSTAFSRKWPWAIAIGISIFQINLRWVDGVWELKLFAIQLLGFGMARINDGPWIVSASIPVFALAVISIDKRYRRRIVGGYI